MTPNHTAINSRKLKFMPDQLRPLLLHCGLIGGTRSMSKANRYGYLLGAMALVAGCAATAQPASQQKWTEFVQTPAHANPIPKQWITTPEGRFAHELKIPNPVPADSGYREGMSPTDYYLHLCAKEAGEFKFKTASGVEGIYFARPPAPATDDDMKDRWKLEHPLVESKFQLVTKPERRAERFVNPPFMDFVFYEEPSTAAIGSFLRMSGLKNNVRDKTGALISEGAPMQVQATDILKSQFAITWRGIRRPMDRENGIAGGEVIVYARQTGEVLYVFRNFAFSGRTRGTPEGVWWLTSGGCKGLFRQEDWPGVYSLSSRARDVLKRAP